MLTTKCLIKSLIQVLTYLHGQFGDNVISHRALGAGRPWPARSPDFNPLDYSLWGIIVEQVYKPKPRTKNELIQRIIRSVNGLNSVLLKKVCRNIRSRAVNCLAANGGYFEDN